MSPVRISIFAILFAFEAKHSIAQETAGSSACSLEGPNNCQLFDGSTNRTISDRGVFLAVADDFLPMGDSLSSLCVWGQYIDNAPGAWQADCALDSAPDDFVVQILVNDDNWPLSIYAQSNAMSQRVPVSLNRDTSGTGQIFLYELTLETPIDGLLSLPWTYWISVTNNSESATKPHCHWHWSQLSPTSTSGNQFAAKGRDDSFEPLFELAADFAFCTNFDIAVGGSGVMQHPCCTCDGNCTIATLAQCDADGGLWDVTADSCNNVTCPAAGPPANDQCTGMEPLSGGVYLFHNVCANTEGLNPVTTELGPTTIGNDIWFSYQNNFNCFLSFGTCHSYFDTVIAVYYNPDNPNVCPCPTDENLEQFLLGAADERCSGGSILGGGGYVPGAEFDCGNPGCYTIRVGGFNGESGAIVLDVNCSLPEFGFGKPPPPVADPSPAKTRFISMTIPEVDYPCGFSGSDQLAVRVRLTSLHHVNPPYNIGASTPFTAFEGQVRWVGPPRQYFESSSTQSPFFASMLQCMPHYRDWSTLGLLHVTGSAIVPSSTYEVETVGGQCQGNESHSSCQPGGFNVSAPVAIKTTRWADVAEAYNPPDPTAQPNIADVASMVNKFRTGLVLPWKARVLIAGPNAFGEITTVTLTTDFNFSHIAYCVDAFRGNPYPYKMGLCAGAATPPATGACSIDADCGGNNGTPPCRLFATGKCAGASSFPFTGDCTVDSQCVGNNGRPPCTRFYGCP